MAPITDKEIIERLERKMAQKKFIIKTKYRSEEDDEDYIIDKDRYFNTFRPKR